MKLSNNFSFVCPITYLNVNITLILDPSVDLVALVYKRNIEINYKH